MEPLELYTPNGWVEIAVYEPGTFDFEPLEVYTADGWRVPYFKKNAAKADTAIELFTQTYNWVGLNSRGIIPIEDFEDGSDNGWSFRSSGEDADADVVSPGLDGSTYAWRHSNFVETHLAGRDAVVRGPQPGDTWEFWFDIDSSSGNIINRVEFSTEGLSDDSFYRIEMEATSPDPEFQLEKFSNGNRVENETDPGVEFAVEQTYSVEIDWRDSDPNAITIQAFEEPSHNPYSNPLTIQEPSPANEHENPGIVVFTNENNTCIWDCFRILP